MSIATALPPQDTQSLRPRYEGLRVTREEYLDLEEDGFKYDVIDGVMVMSPSAGFEHGKIELRLGRIFSNYLAQNLVGVIVAEVDVLLPDGGDPLRPDISLILNENLHFVKNHIHGTPDLVAEVLSPHARVRDLGIKAERYRQCGVKEYWIADPDTKALAVWYNRRESWEKVGAVMEIHSGGQVVAGSAMEFHSRVLPGLGVRAEEVFG